MPEKTITTPKAIAACMSEKETTKAMVRCEDGRWYGPFDCPNAASQWAEMFCFTGYEVISLTNPSKVHHV